MSEILLCIMSGAAWVKAVYATAEARAIDTLWRYGTDALRLAIGTVFIWFGLLKIAGDSPAAPLVIQTLTALHVTGGPMVAVLGAIETLIGLALCFGMALRSTLLLFLMQQAGTWLVLVLRPDVAFQDHHPWLLTMTGEFVVKNLVLMVGGIVSVVGRLHRETARRESVEDPAPAWPLADTGRFHLQTDRAV